MMPEACRIRQHPARPSIGIAFSEERPHRVHPLRLFLFWHRQCRCKCPGGIADQPRIHDQRMGQLARSTGAFAQNQDATFVVARAHEFLGHQVHAVVEAADIAEVGGAKETIDFRGVVVRFEEHDRPVLVPAKTAVDALRRFTYPRSQLAIRGQALTARLGNLNEDKPFAEFRM
jgi:hypothetical protein